VAVVDPLMNTMSLTAKIAKTHGNRCAQLLLLLQGNKKKMHVPTTARPAMAR